MSVAGYLPGSEDCHSVHGLGKADDNQNSAPDVRSNGLVIERRDSRFTTTYGDEPGIGLGVTSGTVGDVVTPVSETTHSSSDPHRRALSVV